MRAEEAYRLTMLKKSEKLNNIYNLIMDSAKKGEFHLTLLSKVLTPDELRHIGHNGYILRAENGFLTIDWSEANGGEE